jgi:hypothetical protein
MLLYSAQTLFEPNNPGTNEDIELFFVFVLCTKNNKMKAVYVGRG